MRLVETKKKSENKIHLKDLIGKYTFYQGEFVLVNGQLAMVEDNYIYILGTPTNIEDYLLQKIEQAFNYRKHINGSKRLVYGVADGLPGLTVDSFDNVTWAKVNTYGMFRYHQLIGQIIKNLLDKDVYFSSHVFQFENIPLNKVIIREHEFTFEIPVTLAQSKGYYLDHRCNRIRLINKLKELSLPVKSVLDLFSFVGSWSFHILKDFNVENCDLVDQGDFAAVISNNYKLNNLKGTYTYHRKDVFDFLKDTDKKYDLVIIDPPAFSKSARDLINAKHGYSKLLKLLFKNINSGGFLVVASCTYGISLQELDILVHNASNLKLRLVDIGLQSEDHPISGFKDEGYYLKYMLYQVF